MLEQLVSCWVRTCFCFRVLNFNSLCILFLYKELFQIFFLLFLFILFIYYPFDLEYNCFILFFDDLILYLLLLSIYLLNWFGTLTLTLILIILITVTILGRKITLRQPKYQIPADKGKNYGWILFWGLGKKQEGNLA